LCSVPLIQEGGDKKISLLRFCHQERDCDPRGI
jgi:hypothetical protein